MRKVGRRLKLKKSEIHKKRGGGSHKDMARNWGRGNGLRGKGLES